MRGEIVFVIFMVLAHCVFGQNTKADSSKFHEVVVGDKDTLEIVNPENLSAIDSVELSATYQFKDGFYLSRKQFLNNMPIAINRVLSTVPYTDPQFYDKVLMTGGFQILLPDSSFKYVPTTDVFGFVQNRIFYLNLGELGFVRLSNFGKICYLAYGRSRPRVQPTAGVGMNSWGGAGVGVGIQINGGGPEVTEYIFRIEGGPIVEFTPEMLLEMIKDDEIIFNSYLALNKRFRLKEMHNTLHEYNRRNPLYVPIHKH